MYFAYKQVVWNVTIIYTPKLQITQAENLSMWDLQRILMESMKVSRNSSSETATFSGLVRYL